VQEVVANSALLTMIAASVGDTLTISTGRSAQLRMSGDETRAVLVGEARFLYVPPGLPALSAPLRAVQELLGEAGRDRMSLAMASVRADTGRNPDNRARTEAVRQWIEDTHSRVTAISTETAIVQVEERLAYFRQLAFILGALSLVIGILLVTTLVSLSVNERLGELAVLRAIGVARVGVLQQIMLEGLMLGAAGITIGLGLGLVTARWLNTILRDFPGLPADLDFFVWSPEAAWKALALLLIASTLAGAWPAWRASQLRVAQALREESIG
jgi:putative ABC transport system permease protein